MKFDDLEYFKEWWMQHRPFKPPLAAVSIPSKNISGIVLYRQAPYQVQLFIFDKNISIPAHKHKTVDSFEHYVCGQVYFHKNGTELLPREDFYDNDGVAAPLINPDKPCIVRVGPDDLHGAEIGPLGGSFLSIQKWLSGEPSLVELDWEGEYLDETHKEALTCD